MRKITFLLILVFIVGCSTNNYFEPTSPEKTNFAYTNNSGEYVEALITPEDGGFLVLNPYLKVDFKPNCVSEPIVIGCTFYVTADGTNHYEFEPSGLIILCDNAVARFYYSNLEGEPKDFVLKKWNPGKSEWVKIPSQFNNIEELCYEVPFTELTRYSLSTNR